MNIYQKINQVKQDLLGLQIKAETKGYNYMYIDLPKIEGAITKACDRAGLLTIVNFPEGRAEMAIINMDEAIEQVVISVPVDPSMVKINDKQPIQNVGGMMTYMRRYLYMAAFSISEHDPVEEKALEDAENPQPETPAERFSAEELQDRIAMLDYLSEIDPKAVEKLMAVKKVSSVDDLETSYIRKVYNAKQEPKA